MSYKRNILIAVVSVCLFLPVGAVVLLRLHIDDALAKSETRVSPNEGEEWTNTDPDGNGLHVNKYAEANDDGSYSVTLEQWLNGEERNVPLDIVLVLDTSGSMEDEFIDEIYESELDQDTVYWVLLNNGTTSQYYPVSYCSYCRQWYIYSSGSGAYTTCTDEHVDKAATYGYGRSSYYYHTNYNYYYTPKTSYSSSGTQFYEYEQGKLTNLKTAAKSFIDIIAKEGAEKDVDHNIALLKFANNISYEVGNDTCTFSYNKGSGVTGTTTGNCTQVVAPLQNAETGQTSLDAAVDSLSATGSTRTDYAMQLAQYVLNQSQTGHKQIVVLFTDGEPQDPMGDLHTDWSSEDVVVANTAISYANAIKQSGAEVYTIGLLKGLDDSVPASAVTPSTTREKNSRFLHALSSNYPSATDMNTLGSSDVENYTDRYFYGTSDSTELNNIFDTIATRSVQEAVLELLSISTMHDEITRYFDLDQDSVSCYTQDYNGTSFEEKKTPISLKVHSSANDDGTTTLDVTGFAYDKEYCMPTKKPSGDYGKKLIIEFNITPKDEFVGGNAVPTNAQGSAIYNGDELIDEYPKPLVNVSLSRFAALAADYNLYLHDSMSAAQLADKCSGYYYGRNTGTLYTLPFDSTGACLLDWQDDYATVSEEVSTPAGEVVTDTTYAHLTDDDDYIYAIRAVCPKQAVLPSTGLLAAPNRQPGPDALSAGIQASGSLSVFLPGLTFKDAIVDYGQIEPDTDFYNANDYEAAQTQWTNALKGSSEGKNFVYSEPELSVSYELPTGSVFNNRIASLFDIPVQVHVARDNEDITPYLTSLSHHDCNTADACQWDNCTWPVIHTVKPQAAFLLHVKASALLPQAGGSYLELYFIVGLTIGAFALVGLVYNARHKSRR